VGGPEQERHVRVGVPPAPDGGRCPERDEDHADRRERGPAAEGRRWAPQDGFGGGLGGGVLCAADGDGTTSTAKPSTPSTIAASINSP
jgi:hypothetical protein